MKQVVQNLGAGGAQTSDVPPPSLKPECVLIKTRRSLVSAGTERMLSEFGESSWLERARKHPDKVKQVLDKARTDGVRETARAVKGKLDQPMPAGYSSAGTVLEVGHGVTGFSPGDRVASNGRHAEVQNVPAALCAKIPEQVSDDEAAFTVLGAIALQGIRLAQPTLGERFVVTGLGLVGLLTVQILRANGCKVLGVDPQESRRRIAESFGATTVDPNHGDLLASAGAFSYGRGVDGVLLTLSADSDKPVHQAAQMCRKRGRIVLVGVTGLHLRRDDFYEKELTFQVSCSYGPGRYDAEYEEKGHDYPIGFVRWTEQRNFEAVLEMMADGRLDVKPLISHRFALDDAAKAYELLTSGKPSLGILLEYDGSGGPGPATVQLQHHKVAPSGSRVSFIGAGNYGSRMLMPAFAKAGATLASVATRSGVSAVHHGKKNGFERATADVEAAIEDANAVVIATRHDSHANLVIRSLEAGRHVFVEKPLALTHEEIDNIQDVASKHPDRLLMVGFNRRFAPLIQELKSHLDNQPKAMVMTVNAGEIPKDHWTQDPHVGGGRIIGEACHFIDLMRFLADSPIAGQQAVSLGDPSGRHDDSATITLTFKDGSIGTIHYLTNGSKRIPKERLEVFSAGRVARLDNFRELVLDGWGRRATKRRRQDKGQQHCVRTFVDAVRQGGPSPIPPEEILEVSRATIEIADSLRG